ncbi:MAG: hypothetical protein Q8P46_11975 [Hyphomicrobiales bacterium]|nr:hypothetical protein [Hyphomicrobiales bacterium]
MAHEAEDFVKPLSEIYRKAAELIDRNEEIYSCRAVASTAYGDDWSPEEWSFIVDPYADLFKPVESASSAEHWLHGTGLAYAERKAWRVLALCFMAAIAEDSEITKRRIS